MRASETQKDRLGRDSIFASQTVFSGIFDPSATVGRGYSRSRIGSSFAPIALGLAMGLALGISSCAPALSVRDLEPSLSLSARGEVAWAIDGNAFAASPPAYSPERLTPSSLVSSVAWRDGAPWVALPGAGLVQRALGVPETISLPGRPARLSSKYIFTTASTVLGYGGAQIAQLPGIVRDVLEVGEITYVLIEAQDQSLVYRLDKDGATLIDRIYPGIPFEPSRYNIVPTDLSYEFLPRPAARANGITYRAQGARLEAVSRGSVVASAALDAAPLAVAANRDTVAVLSRTALEVFSPPQSGGATLERLAKIPFGGTP